MLRPSLSDLQMSVDQHTRANQLIAQERVEGITQAEREWLAAHMQECVLCADLARRILGGPRGGREAPHDKVYAAFVGEVADAHDIRVLSAQRECRVKKRRILPGSSVSIELAARCHAVTAASSVSTSTPAGE